MTKVDFHISGELRKGRENLVLMCADNVRVGSYFLWTVFKKSFYAMSIHHNLTYKEEIENKNEEMERGCDDHRDTVQRDVAVRRM